MDNLEQLVNMEKVTAISGDMNICLDKHPNCLLFTALNDLGFKQLVTDPTHRAGGRIDHLYLRDPDSLLDSFLLTSYVPYYSDHDALCLSITPKVPYFSIIITDFDMYFSRSPLEATTATQNSQRLLIHVTTL